MTHETDQTERRVRAFFDREARRFPVVNEQDASWVRRLGNALFRRSLRLRHDRVMKECANPDGIRILDIGCGPGAYSVALAQAGALSVIGIDLAPAMIDLARRHAAQAGVGDRCQFVVTSLDDYHADTRFGCVIVMGVMDYVEHADRFVEKVVSLTGAKALFSFPKKEGFLAWQRRMRYRKRCPLYMYTKDDLDCLFGTLNDFTYTVESIARDWLVVVRRVGRVEQA